MILFHYTFQTVALHFRRALMTILLGLFLTARSHHVKQNVNQSNLDGQVISDSERSRQMCTFNLAEWGLVRRGVLKCRGYLSAKLEAGFSASVQFLRLRYLPYLTLHCLSPPPNNLSPTFNKEHLKFLYQRFCIFARKSEAFQQKVL